MAAWKGIVGRGFTAAEFEDYVRTLTFGAWRPQFTVVHNTAIPGSTNGTPCRARAECAASRATIATT